MTINQSIQGPIGVAIAGLGFGEKVHLPALRSNPYLEPVALWHPRKERLEESYKKHGIIGYQNWDEVLDNPKIKALVIATPPSERFQLAYKALEAGKHLLLEKPVALNSSQIEKLQRLAIKNQLSVAVDFEYRAVPVFMQAKHLLEQGVVGTPWLVKLDWLMSSRADKSRAWNWYSQSQLGGGVIGALGTHAIDMLHWLCGTTLSANATLSTSIKQRPIAFCDDLKTVTSEDIALAQLELCELNGETIFPAQISLSAVALQGRGCWIEVYGSKGSLLLGSNNQKDYVHGFGLWAANNGEPLTTITPNEEFTFSKTWTDGRIAPVERIQRWWAKSIYEGQPIIPGLSEGLASQKVCDMLKESAVSGNRLAIK